MSEPAPLLFTPTRVGSVELKNRVFGVAHGTALTRRGVPTEDDLAYWEARAAGGAAALIIGGTTTHTSGVLRDRVRAEPWLPEALEQMRERAARIHRHGAAVLIQLNHLGREGVGGSSEYAGVAPSAIRSPRDVSTPHPLSIDEIDELIEAIVTCAVRIQETGHDGVELHAAHGYLIAQFLSPAANHRDDPYGGDLIGRMRFLEALIAGVREHCGRAFLLGVRLSADEERPDGMHLEDTAAIVKRLEQGGAVDYLNITLGQRGGYVKDVTHPEGVAVQAAGVIKRETSLPVLVAGRILAPAMAERILQEGSADLIGMARQLIVDPSWPRKAAAGQDRAIRPCIGLNQECRTFPGGILCAANATVGRERWFGSELRAARREGMRLAVVGGGVAGLEAARLAAELGGAVTLYERSSELGGQLRLAAAVRSRAGLLALAGHLEHEARRLGAEIVLGTEAGVELLTGSGFDAIILATGARPLPPGAELMPPPGLGPGGQPDAVAGRATLVSAWDLLGGARPAGDRAVVADDGRGFWEAVSAAELLGETGVAVTLATPAGAIGGTIPFESIGPLLRRLAERGVAFRTFSRLTAVRTGAAGVTDTLTGVTSEIAADFVVAHAGAIAQDGLVAELAAHDIVVRTIGDCVSPRRLTHATWDATRTVLELTRADAVPLRRSPRPW